MKLLDEPTSFNLVSLHVRLNSHYEGWSYKSKKKKMKIIEDSRPESKILVRNAIGSSKDVEME